MSMEAIIWASVVTGFMFAGLLLLNLLTDTTKRKRKDR